MAYPNFQWVEKFCHRSSSFIVISRTKRWPAFVRTSSVQGLGFRGFCTPSHSLQREHNSSFHHFQQSRTCGIHCSAMAEQSPATSARNSAASRRMPPPFKPPGDAAGAKKKRKVPAELIAHYTAKGMDERAASEKVIDDLQKALSFSFESYPTQKVMMMDKALKSNVEAFNKRLSVLDAKVDSKPSLPAIFGAGVAAGGVLKVVWDGVPHVLRAVAEITKDTRVSSSTSRV